jgi:hypothetical protein
MQFFVDASQGYLLRYSLNYYAQMDVPETREMMVRQATGMIVSMVSVVVSTLKRLRDEPEPHTEPNPLLYSLRADAEQHRQRTLQAIYNSTDVECVSMCVNTKIW